MDVRRTTDRQANGHTDVQCEIIIPHHYRVAGYKNQRMSYTEVIIKDLSQKKKIYGEKLIWCCSFIRELEGRLSNSHKI